MPVLSLACHLPHNTPHIPSRYNNEQTTKETKAINNSYIYINISCKCDTNRAGHFTLDAYASRPVACSHYWCALPGSWLTHWPCWEISKKSSKNIFQMQFLVRVSDDFPAWDGCQCSLVHIGSLQVTKP